MGLGFRVRIISRMLGAAGRRAGLLMLLATAMSAVPAVGLTSAADTENLTIEMEVASLGSLDLQGCQAGTAATDLGSIVANKPDTTGDCIIEFGATGGTATLLAYQADSVGNAMHSLPFGGLDTDGFGGGDGAVVQDLGASEWALGVEPDNAGRIIVVGRRNDDALVARFLADGSLDTAGFNAPDGYLTWDSGGVDEPWAAVVDDAGTIFVAGTSNGRESVLMMRIEDDGTVAWVQQHNSGPGQDYARDVQLLPDGDLLANGTSTNPATEVMLVRVDSGDGSTVGDWGTGGFVHIGVSTDDRSWRSVLIDDYILVGGWSTVGGDRAGTIFKVALEDGSLDQAGFNAPDGYVRIDTPGSSGSVDGLGVLDDGSIMYSGEANTGVGNRVLVGRANPNGSPHAAVSPNGYILYDLGVGTDQGNDAWISPDGRFTVVGNQNDGGTPKMFMGRYLPDATPDPQFNDGADAEVFDLPGGEHEMAEAVAALPDGRLALGGWSGDGAAWDIGLAVLDAEQFGDFGVDGDFTGGASIFGACLRQKSATVTLDGTTWTQDVGNDCGTQPADAWNALDDAAGTYGTSVVAHSLDNGVTDATVRLRFGALWDGTLPPGRYYSQLIFESVSPNL